MLSKQDAELTCLSSATGLLWEPVLFHCSESVNGKENLCSLRLRVAKVNGMISTQCAELLKGLKSPASASHGWREGRKVVPRARAGYSTLSVLLFSSYAPLK